MNRSRTPIPFVFQDSAGFNSMIQVWLTLKVKVVCSPAIKTLPDPIATQAFEPGCSYLPLILLWYADINKYRLLASIDLFCSAFVQGDDDVGWQNGKRDWNSIAYGCLPFLCFSFLPVRVT
jgi:hypothetical protein